MATKAKPKRGTTQSRTPARAVPRGRSGKPKVVARRSKPVPIPVVVKPPVNPGLAAFNRAMKSLSTLADFERLRIVRYNNQNFDLDRMRLLLKRIGNPHEAFRSIHIAGTKGKGSTAAMVSAMLQASGYKVGLYTSPHLVDIRERMTI